MKTAKLLLAAAALILGSATAANAVSSGWAVVASNGALIRGGGALGAAHEDIGDYTVQFGHSVRKCVFTANLGDGNAGTPGPGYVTVAGALKDANSVFIATYDQHGDHADLGFHLNVRC